MADMAKKPLENLYLNGDGIATKKELRAALAKAHITGVNSETNAILEVLMEEVVGFIKDGDTAVQIIPMLKEYLEINVKNDEQLVKLATIVQRITAAEKRISDSGDEFGLSESEKEQLMNAIESDVQELQIKKDEIESSISKEN